jgi:hypothetical protein
MRPRLAPRHWALSSAWMHGLPQGPLVSRCKRHDPVLRYARVNEQQPFIPVSHILEGFVARRPPSSSALRFRQCESALARYREALRFSGKDTSKRARHRERLRATRCTSVGRRTATGQILAPVEHRCFGFSSSRRAWKNRRGYEDVPATPWESLSRANCSAGSVFQGRSGNPSNHSAARAPAGPLKSAV